MLKNPKAPALACNHKKIAIRGASSHNLKRVDLDIRHGSFTVLTGVSGSGKSTLAFDTLFAEGQRQYIDSLSPYARQFVDSMPRPEVDSIVGLQPTLCIDQRQSSLSPRSTLATVAEIHDYLRLLMARAGIIYCYKCGTPILQQSSAEIVDAILTLPTGTKMAILAPIVRDRKGAHADVFQKISKAGLLRARVDTQMVEVESPPALEVRRNHSIDAVCDRIVLRDDSRERIAAAVGVALQLADGLVSLSILDDESESLRRQDRLFSTKYACPSCGISYPEVEPRIFSFNSPHGACTFCDGVGYVPLSNAKNSGRTSSKASREDSEGTDTSSETVLCPQCRGARLKPESLAVKIDMHSIDDISKMTVESSAAWFAQLSLQGLRAEIASPIVIAIRHRLDFLAEVGVGYLTLNRAANTLSGGELQRVRLASSIGSGLIGVCYVLDEPSIGLHPRDSDRLIGSILKLRDQGNTVVVVEHDRSMMLAADTLVDLGPGAGPEGGNIIAIGTPSEVSDNPNSITGPYLKDDKLALRELREGTGHAAEELTSNSTPSTRIRSSKPDGVSLSGCRLNNLKNLSVTFPQGRMIGITGVSGSGKSTLINDSLVPLVKAALSNKADTATLVQRDIGTVSGVSNIERLIVIDQKSIGRSSRSTPSTYTGLWDEIRKVYAQTRDAKQRGFAANRFSFNAGDGRCENCNGAGTMKIEMNFLADMHVRCPRCGGRRFNRTTLAVRYKEKNVADVLQMSVREACDFFKNFSKVSRILETLRDVGLGYLSLGQPSYTLSGGEAQRIKLATELSKPSIGKSLYVLDEPTTGLHIKDVVLLTRVLQRLVAAGNTVIVIEHQMEFIQTCDWVIGLGPDGGERGGEIVATGSPEELEDMF